MYQLDNFVQPYGEFSLLLIGGQKNKHSRLYCYACLLFYELLPYRQVFSFILLSTYSRRDKSVDQLAVADAAMDHKLRIHGNGSEAGDSIDLIEYELTLGSVEKVNS